MASIANSGRIVNDYIRVIQCAHCKQPKDDHIRFRDISTDFDGLTAIKEFLICPTAVFSGESVMVEIGEGD